MIVRDVDGRLTFPELPINLPPQNMKQIRRRRHIRNLHITILMLSINLLRSGENTRILIAQLQVPFNTTGRMLRSLTIVSMREGHDESRALQPFHLSRGDELIDDALRVVGEVAELGFPHHQGVGGG